MKCRSPELWSVKPDRYHDDRGEQSLICRKTKAQNPPAIHEHHNHLTHLAVHQKVSASTQNQALCALLFLFKDILATPLADLSNSVRAKRGRNLLVVPGIPETVALLAAMSGTTRLMAALIYGGGLRVSECCELRRKDIDFDQGLIFVRGGKGAKDRSTVLAEACRDALRAHLEKPESLHRADRLLSLLWAAVNVGATLADSNRAVALRHPAEMDHFLAVPSVVDGS